MNEPEQIECNLIEETTQISEENPAQNEGTPTQTNDKNPSKTTFLGSVLEYLDMFIPCLVALLLCFTFAFRVCSVEGRSMLPTLQDGERLVISSIGYTPKQGDIVVFHQTSSEYPRFNEPIIKRVIATAGQEVVIDFTEGTVTVDGVLLEEPYIQLLGHTYTVYGEHDTHFETDAEGKQHRVLRATVPDGSLFVMGDNRNESADSRSNAVGFVDERRVLGHVLFRFLPFSAFGSVE